MKVEGRKPSPYDKLSERMTEGTREQARITRPGTAFQQRMQQRIPKITPGAPSGRRKA
jgi:hypothetical protein